MNFPKSAWLLCGLLVISSIFIASGLAMAQGTPPPPTTLVAIIDSPEIINGGVLPTEDPAFSAFSFKNVAVNDVNKPTLSGFDIVVLNVASPGMGCTTDALTASQKDDLIAFVRAGGKLIIYDSVGHL